jgi:hypothetical protein
MHEASHMIHLYINFLNEALFTPTSTLMISNAKDLNSQHNPSDSSMASEEPPSNIGAPLRRSFTVDDSTHSRIRRTTPNPLLPPPRRGSTFSDLSDARRSFQASTDDLLLPRPSVTRNEASNTSAWHSAPLVFALLPAVGGMLFKNGGQVITDVMLLGLAAVFLNWSVRLPCKLFLRFGMGWDGDDY